MEVGKGIVYPRMYTLDDVPIDSVSFVVVKMDMVHENTKNLNLEVAPDDTILTLRDAVTRRVHVPLVQLGLVTLISSLTQTLLILTLPCLSKPSPEA
jgi:hypothetical protein